VRGRQTAPGIAGALIGAAVIPGVSFAEALILAIVLACTDAALGQAVVSDERIPSRIRQGLNGRRRAIGAGPAPASVNKAAATR
jgi:hypothetical protein